MAFLLFIAALILQVKVIPNICKLCSDASKERIAENTYLLALDGDVDFQPDAALRLVDLMKKNKGVGAACGRIHPTGSGYMPGNVNVLKMLTLNFGL